MRKTNVLLPFKTQYYQISININRLNKNRHPGENFIMNVSIMQISDGLWVRRITVEVFLINNFESI